MVLTGDVWDEGSLGTRPSHDLVKELLEAVSRIDSELEWKIKAIVTLPSPLASISLSERLPRLRWRPKRRELQKHRTVLQHEELYQMYHSIVKKSEKPKLSRTEADIQGNMKLDLSDELSQLHPRQEYGQNMVYGDQSFMRFISANEIQGMRAVGLVILSSLIFVAQRNN